LLGYRLLQQNQPDSHGSSRLIVMPRESGASSNSRAIAEMMQRLNRGRWIPDRPVKPGDDGSGIQVLETEHRVRNVHFRFCALSFRDTIRMPSYTDCRQMRVTVRET
jgi:hypothetical protein